MMYFVSALCFPYQASCQYMIWCTSLVSISSTRSMNNLMLLDATALHIVF